MSTHSAAGILTPLSRAVREILVPCAPGETFREVVRLCADPVARAQSLVPVILRNPVYTEFIESMDLLRSRIRTWEEEEKGNARAREVILERTVSLLQKTATRNAVACIQLNRIAGTGIPRKKSDKLVLAPREQIRFALQAEEECVENSFPGTDQAFIAGYHYDALSALFAARKAPKDAKDALERAWKDGLRAARIAARLVGSMRSFHHHSHAFGGALLAPVGKALMAYLFPKEQGSGAASSNKDTLPWSAFVAQCEKAGENKELLEWVSEHHSFPVAHAELSSLLVTFMGFFTPVERAIAHSPDPQRLFHEDRELYRLAGVISAANTLSSTVAQDRFVSRLNAIQLKALEDTGLKREQLEELFKRILAQEKG